MGGNSLNSSLILRHNGRDGSCDSTGSQFSKKNNGDLYLYEGAKGSKTPGFGSASKRMKDSISMQKILQPYIALDLINVTKDGFVTNDSQIPKSVKSTKAVNMKSGLGVDRRDTSRLPVQPEMGVIKEEIFGGSLNH